MGWRNYIKEICDDIDTAIRMVNRERKDSLQTFDDYWNDVVKTLETAKRELDEVSEI